MAVFWIGICNFYTFVYDIYIVQGLHLSEKKKKKLENKGQD